MLAKYAGLNEFTIVEQIRDSLLIVALAFSTATALRTGAYSLGVGEIFFLLWALVSIAIVCFRKEVLIDRRALGVVIFWVFSIFLLAAGYFNAARLGLNSTGVTHDFVAYGFVLFLVSVYSCCPSRDVKKILLWSIALNLIVTYFVLLFALVSEKDASIRFWLDWTPWKRFLGLSANPNQLALQITPVVFMLVALYKLADSKWKKSLLALLTLFAMQIGYNVRSDAWYVAVESAAAAAIFLFVFFYWLDLFKSKKKVAIVVPLISLLLVSVMVAVFKNDILSRWNYLYYSDGGQGDLRLSLWKHAIEAAAHSIWVGLGPGPHSGDKAPFLNWEAHNIFLDWLSMTGIVGEVAFMVLLAAIGRDIVRRESIIWVASFVALLVFSFFHFTFRQPIFWFYIVLIWQMATLERNQFYSLQWRFKLK